MIEQNPAPVATNPVEDQRVQPDGPLSGEVKRGGDTEPDAEVRWLPVLDFEGYYEVSSCGQVRSVPRIILGGGPKRMDGSPCQRRSLGGAMASRPNTSGYMQTQLTVDGRPFTRTIHRLVCEAFNGPAPFEGALVRHLNGEKLDNRPENLAWGTFSDNVADAIRHNRVKPHLRKECARLTDTQASAIRAAYLAGALVKPLAEAFGISESHVKTLAAGRRNSLRVEALTFARETKASTA